MKLSSLIWLWSALKQVSTRAQSLVLGSYTASCRPLWRNGKNLPNLLPSGPHQAGCLWLSRPRTATHTRPRASIATDLGSPLRLHALGPQTGDGVGEALNGIFKGVASEGTRILVIEFATGSRTVRLSVI